MIRSLVIHAATAAIVLSSVACGGGTPPADTPTSEAGAEAEAPEEPSSEEASPEPNSLQLVADVAAKVAAAWDAQAQAEEEILLSLRIQVDGKSARVEGTAGGAEVIEGAGAVGAADVTVDLTVEQAQAIIAGESSFKSLAADGSVETDNADGLKRFIGFLKD